MDTVLWESIGANVDHATWNLVWTSVYDTSFAVERVAIADPTDEAFNDL